MEFTLQQLNQYDGSNPSKLIYMAVRGWIFDVTAEKSFYGPGGPGGPYGMFAGKEVSRALAKMSKNEEDVCASLDGLSVKEIGVLNDWEKKFEANYSIVGRVVS
ncbi:putative steroid-binding protein 3 [Camellia lanceoleosa]|uniref:Steroid-binding protein 3 n=1 Tax=Camellia lanceoleosa TaxID=1840588 RepID=A0ACC0I429_9ERIC|nr:putative steroid-binding protein 3 [Camellia lanceoleosa]